MKVLYRASFCQTLAEVEAPTGEWKSILGVVLIGVSIGIWGYIWMKTVVYPPLPETITNEEKQKAVGDELVHDILQVSGGHLPADDVNHLLPDVPHLSGLHKRSSLLTSPAFW